VMVQKPPRGGSGVRAPDCVLDRAGKGIELEDIDVRLSELERGRDSRPGDKK
jgi:hypothetical protein